MEQNKSIYKTLRIYSIKKETDSFSTVIFESGHDIVYASGQYLTLVMFQNGEEIRRSYSITSSPVLQEPLSIGVKRVVNSTFSRMLVDAAEPGAEILTIGSGGFFCFARRHRQLPSAYFLCRRFRHYTGFFTD